MRKATLCLVVWCVGCGGSARDADAPSDGEATCGAPDGPDFAADDKLSIRRRLESAAFRVTWESVPQPYRDWAARQLTAKLEIGSDTLSASASCEEIERAAAQVPEIANRIAEVAKQCTDAECAGTSVGETALQRRVKAATCPMYPFC